MKKIILLCCFTLFSVSCLLSQNTETDEKKSFQLPKNEFHISWGDPLISSIMMSNFYWGMYDYMPPPYQQYNWFDPVAAYKKTYYIGSFSLSYYHRFKKWFWFGGTISTTSTYGGKSYDAITKEPLPYCNATYLSFAPAIRFSYLNKKYVTLYSGLALGPACIFTTTKEKNTKRVDTNVGMYMQWTFFGASFGNKIFGNVEVGLGMKGILSVGLGYKF